MPYRKQFLDAIKQGAIDGWHKHKILPSIAGVQALHESDYGRSSLAKAPNYNIFGIKASADWNGAIVSMPTQEHVNGRTITIQANFRKYGSWGDSVADYGMFFTSTEWRKNNYRHVVGERDYKKAAWALQNSGYATDPQYANKLIKRLEENGLQAWDADIDKVPSGTVNRISVGGNLTQAGRDYLKNIPVTVLGDSLGVGTQPKLKEIMDNMTYSVHGSRQLTHSSQLVLDATRMLEGMLSQPEKVRNNLVVIIGTNAGLVRSDVDKFIKIAGNRKIYWVNTASKGVINQARRDNVTNEIRRAAETYSNVYLLDWDKFSAPNWSSYYGGDSVHMNVTGYTKHAEFIAQGIYEVLNSKQTEAPSIPKEQRDDDGVQLKKSYIGIENIEYDDGRFYTLKGESSIQDREANLRFSRHHSSSFGWITRPANFDLDNPNELFTEALAKLKEYSEPKIDYEVPTKLLPNSIDIGDWVDIIDHQYTPPLYVKAQVKSMRESETDEDGNVATLANYQAVESGLAAELIETQKKLKLIENSLNDENKIELSILSSQGAVFDGDITSTLLTAQLKLNGEIMTNYADSYVWWRVVDPLSEDKEWMTEGGPSLTVEENQFAHSATYKVLAKKEGRVLSENKFDLTKVVSGTHKGDSEPILAVDGENWTKPDGSQWVKVNGEWEEKVVQAVVINVNEDIAAAKGIADAAKAEADKANDSWAVKRLNGAGDIVSQINLSDDTFLIEAKHIVGIGDVVIDGKLTVTEDMIAGTISANKIYGGAITGTTFVTTESATGFSTRLYNGAIEFRHQIFTLGHIHATTSSVTSMVNGFAVVQRPGYTFSINSKSNLPDNNTSTAVIQVPTDSTSESRKLNIFAQGSFRIYSDTFNVESDKVIAKKPFQAADGFIASHAQSDEGAVIADAGNLIYSVDKAGSVMIHRFMVRRKDGTWPNNGLAIYEDGRVAVVVNGVWKQL